ncbi:hypothetical protein BSR29_07490 [Boudabousia liubingyangii]|uniref:Uncharacterized protein n=1 Tax=Boudabousia liubingyangii TaxID=1921764 RepID=A0A1Q5PKA5_9ACTO|nr:hypothetical protein [Boudabousia liubingyangii]OKL46650.1 hypothetical protein BSR29_07490 [Boudabousia liubingyangii]OKL46762.1 hypothetical protein BSR28_04780 [Boudabousia liubingyangii]
MKPYNSRFHGKPSDGPGWKNPLVWGAAALGAAASAAVFRLNSRTQSDAKNKLEQKIMGLPGVVDVAVLTRRTMTTYRIQAQVQTDLDPQDPNLKALAEQVLKTVWDQAQTGPAAIDLQVRSNDPQAPLVTSKDLDFEAEIAYPHEVFDRLGAPACDPDWRP